MATIEQSIDLAVPVQTAYNQWTQFEDFPRFMDGVEEVRQLDDTRLHWVAEFAGSRHEWDAVITEQHSDERVAWRNTNGKDNAGVVTFHRLDDQAARVMVQMDFVPEGVKEQINDALGALGWRVKPISSASKRSSRVASEPAPGAARCLAANPRFPRRKLRANQAEDRAARKHGLAERRRRSAGRRCGFARRRRR